MCSVHVHEFELWAPSARLKTQTVCILVSCSLLITNSDLCSDLRLLCFLNPSVLDNNEYTCKDCRGMTRRTWQRPHCVDLASKFPKCPFNLSDARGGLESSGHERACLVCSSVCDVHVSDSVLLQNTDVQSEIRFFCIFPPEHFVLS